MLWHKLCNRYAEQSQKSTNVSGVTSPLKLLRSKIPSPSPPLPLEVSPLKPARGSGGSAISSHSWVWGEAPAANDFGAF